MILPIFALGQPVLNKVAAPITNEYEGLKELIDNMWETMYHAKGVGLAAPQVGLPIRLFVIDTIQIKDEENINDGFKKVFINARITERSGDLQLMGEGCLSIPNLREEVSREGRIRISYYDENWEFHDEVYEGFKARVIQHEYDHLDGILFTDKVSPLRRRLIKGKLNAISKGKFEVDYMTILPGQKIR